MVLSWNSDVSRRKVVACSVLQDPSGGSLGDAGVGRKVVTSCAGSPDVALLDSSPLPAWIKSSDQRFLFMNSRGAALIGEPARNLMGRMVSNVYAADIVAKDEASDARTVEVGRPAFEIDWIADKGCWCQKTKIPIRSQTFRGAWVLGVARMVRSVEDVVSAVAVMPFGCGRIGDGAVGGPEFGELLGVAREQSRPRWLFDLHRNVSEVFWPLLRIEDLASAAGVNLDYFSRAFRRYFGISPSLYRKRLQICFATRLLVSSREKATEIACRCGFSDQSHMTRDFHALLGVTPGELRVKLRGLVGSVWAPAR